MTGQKKESESSIFRMEISKGQKKEQIIDFLHGNKKSDSTSISRICPARSAKGVESVVWCLRSNEEEECKETASFECEEIASFIADEGGAGNEGECARE